MGRGPASRVLQFFNSSLRMRVYGLVVFGAAASIAMIGFVDSSGDDVARALAERELRARTDAAALSVAAHASEAQARLAMSDLFVRQGTPADRLCRILTGERYPSYQRLSVFSTRGDLQCSTVEGAVDRPEAFFEATYVRDALATGDDQVAGPLAGPYTGRLSLGFVHPLKDGASPSAVLIAAVDAADVLQPAEAVARTERLIAFGRDGGRYELGKAAMPSLPPGVEAAAAHALTSGAPCPVTVEAGTVWACSRAGAHDLVLLVGHPERSVFADALDAAARQRNSIAGIVAVSIVAAAVNDFLFLRRVHQAHRAARLAPLGASQATRRDEIDALSEWGREARAMFQQAEAQAGAAQQHRLEVERNLLTAMAEAFELRYPFLRDRRDRIGGYVRQIGARLGIPESDLDLLDLAARIHDIGMAVVPDAVLLKPGAFEPIEAAQMQLHAARGAEVVRRMRAVPQSVATAVLHHHERWDGGGYPDGLRGTDIPLWSRIIAVADAYDAMTEERPHRVGRQTHQEALETLRAGAGFQWDVTVVDAFFDVIEAGGVAAKPDALAR